MCDLETSKREGLGPFWAVSPQRKKVGILELNLRLEPADFGVQATAHCQLGWPVSGMCIPLWMEIRSCSISIRRNAGKPDAPNVVYLGDWL